MGLRISTNIASLNAQRQLDTQQKRYDHSLAALSSGSRIVSASDDAAGLAISEDLRGQTRGLAQAKANANNAISIVQTGEGGLNEVNNILIRLRELGVQGASDTLSDNERGYLDTEAQQLLKESDRIAKNTRFGNRKLLDGSGDNLEFQVGAYSGGENVIAFKSSANATNSALGIDSLSVSDKSSSRSSLEQVDSALEKVGQLRANFGAFQSRLNSTVSSLDTNFENLSAANSRLRDTDVAAESSALASSNIQHQAAISVLAQANQQPASALRLLS